MNFRIFKIRIKFRKKKFGQKNNLQVYIIIRNLPFPWIIIRNLPFPLIIIRNLPFPWIIIGNLQFLPIYLMNLMFPANF